MITKSRPSNRSNRKRFLWPIIISVILLIGFVCIKIVANSGLDPVIKPRMAAEHSEATNLIVVVHGFLGSSDKMSNVVTSIIEERPSANVLTLQYEANLVSNADCFQIASNICDEINRHQTTNQYASIELVGYSMGALLLRKAYVYGWGHIDDMDPDPNIVLENRAAQPWVKNVQRFVLLAGTNRGWTTASRSQMGSLRYFAMRAGKFVSWAANTGKVIMQAEAGEPFVANLRMQWLRVMNDFRKSGTKSPTVIQLLGDKDDVVSREDNRDINISKNFIWIQLSGTTHDNATRFDYAESPLKEVGAERKRLFKEALKDQATIDKLRRMNPSLPEAEDTNVVECVVLLHGIRDHGEWTAYFEESLQKNFMKNHNGDEKLCVFRPTYGYFNMVSFILWPERQKKVRWFMDELTELQAKYPYMTNIHFIGHSHGTYVLASALTKYKALKVDRAVFAGSVVRKDFNWNAPALKGRVGKVRNYAGSSDWVVGFFPRLFEAWPFQLLNEDIGSAGFNGFSPPEGMSSNEWLTLTSNKLFETKYVKGSHGTAIENTPDKVKSIVAFVMEGDPTPIPLEVREKQNGWVLWPSEWCILVWVSGLTLIGFVGRWSTPYFRKGIRHISFFTHENDRLTKIISWVAYLWIVLALLKSI